MIHWLVVAASLVGLVVPSHCAAFPGTSSKACNEASLRLLGSKADHCVFGGLLGGVRTPGESLKLMEKAGPQDLVVLVAYTGESERNGRPSWLSFTIPSFVEIENAVGQSDLESGRRPCLRTIETRPALWTLEGWTPADGDVQVPHMLLVKHACTEPPGATLPLERHGSYLTEAPLPLDFTAELISVVPTLKSTKSGDLGLIRVRCGIPPTVVRERRNVIATCTKVGRLARFLGASLHPEVGWTSYVDVRDTAVGDAIHIGFWIVSAR